MTEQKRITVGAIINASVAKVWNAWNAPADIVKWNTPDPSWHCPSSENDLRVNGTFKNRMEAKDGSFGFDFEGIYNNVDLHKEIAYTMPDGRKVDTLFVEEGHTTILTTTFDPETQNDPEFQKQGWQAILNNFVTYVESNN